MEDDKWEPQGLTGDLGFGYIAREGTTAGITRIENIQTSGYGTLGAGTYDVNVSCEEVTTLTSPYTYTTGYMNHHTYVVVVNF